MAGFQKFSAMGHVASGPKQIEKDENSKSDKTKVEFRLAVNEYAKGRSYTIFLPCEAVGSMADNIIKFFTKGSAMYIEGKLKTTKGNADKGLSVLVTQFHFLPKEKTSPDNQPELNEDGVEGEEDNDIGDKEQ